MNKESSFVLQSEFELVFLISLYSHEDHQHLGTFLASLSFRETGLESIENVSLVAWKYKTPLNSTNSEIRPLG